jgi:Ni/Co efflux regulator RcnB
MSKLWLIGLAASAAWAPAAIAQGAPAAPMPHGSHAPAPMVGHSGGGHHVMPPAMHGGGMKGMKGGGHMRVDGHVGGMKGMPGSHHMKGMKGWQRFGRGHVVPPHFRNRQFFVHDWRAFGWPAPMAGGNWIRYYDDALLIDGHGRVVDGRYGWDWDRRGGHMAYDEGGYDRDADYDRDDYGRGGDYGEDEDGYGRGHHDEDDRVVRVYRHGDGYGGGSGDCRSRCAPAGGFPPPPPPHPGYGHGSGGGYGSGYGYGYGMGYGYGYGGGGAVVVTETITTTAPVIETHTYYETVTERRAAPRRHYRKPAVRRSVKPAYRAPAPRPGERG